MRSARTGFTLIELVVVLLLIAVASAVTVPALLAPPQPTDIDYATQRFQLLFRLARDSAVSAGMPVTVSLDSVTAHAWLVTGDGRANVDTAASIRPGALRVDVGESLELPASVRVQMTKARARFRFLPGGAAFGDTLLLRSGALSRALTLDPWTGDAIVY